MKDLLTKWDDAVHNQSRKTFKTKIRTSLSSIKENCFLGCNHLLYTKLIEALQQEQCVSKMKIKKYNTVK